MMKKSALFLTLVMLVIGIIGGSTGAEGAAAAKPARDDVVIHVEAPWNTIDPHGTGAYVDQYLINQLYELLVDVKDDGSVAPSLATSWTISPDGLTYVFALKKGVKFHNGEEMKASDVVFSFTRAKSIPQMYDYTSMIDSVTATGDYEVKIVLKAPFAPFLSYVSKVFILNEKFVTENKGEINKIACGTGPYMLDSIEMNTVATMKAFPGYHKGEAAIKKATFRIIIDTTTSIMAFKAGEIDFFYPSAAQYLEMKKSGQFNTGAMATLHTALIHLNNKVAPFDNKLVRQALNYATDKETMILISFEGLAVPARLLASEVAFGVDYKYAKDYPYDLQKAKALLAEAGYPNGLSLGTMYAIAGGYHEKIAQIFHSSCAQIGVKFDILPMESSTLIEMMSKGNFAFGNMGQSFGNDFAYNSRHYTTASIGSNNFDQYSNPRVDELFTLAQSETDPEKRKAYYNEAVSIITDDAVNIPIQHKELLFAWVKGLHVVPHADSSKPYYVYEWYWER